MLTKAGAEFFVLRPNILCLVRDRVSFPTPSLRDRSDLQRKRDIDHTQDPEESLPSIPTFPVGKQRQSVLFMIC
jgi:hypothetical protein